MYIIHIMYIIYYIIYIYHIYVYILLYIILYTYYIYIIYYIHIPYTIYVYIHNPYNPPYCSWLSQKIFPSSHAHSIHQTRTDLPRNSHQTWAVFFGESFETDFKPWLKPLQDGAPQ